jgi:hypothetical protein
MQLGRNDKLGELMCGGTLDGVDRLFYDWLKLDIGQPENMKADYGNTRAVAQNICRRDPLNDPPPITQAFQIIEGNHVNALKLGPRPPQNSNYRWEKQLAMQGHNSGEKRLEKIAACILGDDWVNQVPVCSGFTWVREGKRAIDLARKINDRECEFIELKYAGQNSSRAGGSDHPLYAGMELLQYGLVYLMARKRSLIKTGVTREYLNSVKKIHLVVLASKEFYEGFDMKWFVVAVNKGLADLLIKEKLPVEMSLRCDALSEDFISFYHRLEELIKDGQIVYEKSGIKSNDDEVNLAEYQASFKELFPGYTNLFC